MRRIYSILIIFAIVGWLSLTVNAAPVLLNAYNKNSSEHDSPGWYGYSLEDSFVEIMKIYYTPSYLIVFYSEKVLTCMEMVSFG